MFRIMSKRKLESEPPATPPNMPPAAADTAQMYAKYPHAIVIPIAIPLPIKFTKRIKLAIP